MLLSEGETVSLNPFIVPRVIKILGEIPSEKKKNQQNVFCLICDVSRNSMLALCNFTEEKFRNRKKKKKNHTGSVFLSSYYLGTWGKMCHL